MSTWTVLLFIYDLPLFMKYCYSDFFADDATFHTHDKLFERVGMKLKSGTDTVKGWSRQNKMHIHYDKTNYMILGGMRKLNDNYEFDLKIGNSNGLRTNFSKSPIQFICNVTYVTFLNICYLSALFVCWANMASRKLFAQMLRISIYPSYQFCTCICLQG